MSDVYKGLYEQQKNSWDELLDKYAKSLSEGYKHEYDLKSLQSSVRGMLRYAIENHLKMKKYDPEAYLCRHYRDQAITLGIILGHDLESIREELDGKKIAVLYENDIEKSIG